MELAVTLLIVALAAAVVLRRAWRLFHSGGKPGCASGCGSCPSNIENSPGQSVVSLDLVPQRRS